MRGKPARRTSKWREENEAVMGHEAETLTVFLPPETVETYGAGTMTYAEWCELEIRRLAGKGKQVEIVHDQRTGMIALDYIQGE